MKIPETLLPQALSLLEAARKHGPHREDLFLREEFKSIAGALRRIDPNLDDWMVLAIALREAGAHLRSST